MSAVNTAAHIHTVHIPRSAMSAYRSAVRVVLTDPKGPYVLKDISTVWVADLVKEYARAGKSPLSCAEGLIGLGDSSVDWTGESLPEFRD